MKILIVGASGATGRLLVKDLLNRGQQVKAIVRLEASLAEFRDDKNLELIQASVLQLSNAEMQTVVKDVNVVCSCLGHNLTVKGMFGKPRRLVRDTAQRLCAAVEATQPDQPVKYLLMNTTGNRNRDLNEAISLAQKVVLALLRVLLPPHTDNEQAADFLRTKVGQKHSCIEWAAIRPDGLIDEDEGCAYEVFASPTRSAIFNAGQTSRINVAHFMAELATNTTCWNKWKGQMPVIYNVESPQ